MIDMAGVPLGMPGAALQGSAPTDVAGTAADGNSPDRQALQEQVATLTAERDAAQRMASEAVAQAEERIAAISVELENARAAIQAAQEEAQQTRRDAVETILYFKQQGGQAHTAAPAQQEVRPEDTGEEQAPEATQGGGIDFGSTGLDMGKEESCSWFWNFVWGC
jgi:chromosome segregation ATPase